MDDIHEEAYFDYLDLREAALEAVLGRILLTNLPTERLELIETGTSNEIVSFACRIVRYQRALGA